MITDGPIQGSAFQSVLSQTYEDTAFSLYIQKRLPNLDPDAQLNRLKMITYARNQARNMALASDCDYVWMVDSDTTPKNNALELLMAANKDVACGWYQGGDGSGTWVCGWIDENKTVSYPEEVQPNLTKVDFSGLGCVLVTRKALSSIRFSLPGTFSLNKEGQPLLNSEATHWTTEMNRLGFHVWMHGDVICDHKIQQPK